MKNGQAMNRVLSTRFNSRAIVWCFVVSLLTPAFALFLNASEASVGEKLASPTGSPHLASPFTSFHELSGTGDSTYTDSRGYKYEIFFPSSRPNLQAIIDDISIDLTKTKIGSSICSSILNHDPGLIENHLSVSVKAANEIARSCLWPEGSIPDPSQNSLVFSSPPEVLNKLSIRPGSNQKRLFILIVTDAPSFPFDSWTDPFLNHTILLVRHTPQYSDLNKIFLTQLLAHELAIYFDGRSWPGTKEWSNIEPNRIFNRYVGTNNLRSMNTVLSNPLISNVFAFIRAFNVERAMIDDMVQNQGLELPDRYSYDFKSFPFLAANYTDQDLIDFVKTQSETLLPLSLPLVAWAPNYRAKKWRDLDDSVAGSQNQLTTDSTLVLKTYAPGFIRLFIESNPLKELLNLPERRFGESAWQRTEKVFATLFFPNEFSFLIGVDSALSSKYRPSDFSVFRFMSEPALSGYNVKGSSGPRPRIRGGGFSLSLEKSNLLAHE